MKRAVVSVILPLIVVSTVAADAVKVTGIKAEHRNGQTFVTWTDAAEGEAGANYRYSLYRADAPITADTLAKADLLMKGVFNNSAKMFGSAFWPKDRLDPTKPTARIADGGDTLPLWSGVAVHTVEKDGTSYYAVVATDLKFNALSQVVPGESATTEPVEERVAPIQPIKVYDSKKRGRYWKQTCISGKQGLPLHVSLHASSGRGGGAGAWGDYYIYWSPRAWGYREGLPGVFAVQERRSPDRLIVGSRDAIVAPSGTRAMETYWFGYYCRPQWADHTDARAYNFTERRTLWIIDLTIRKYGADPERVYCSGGSMGAWGSSTFGFRHPEIFAAVYPNRPRTRQRGLPSLAKRKRGEKVLMFDGKTGYFDRMDMVKFASEHHGDLPFLGWCCGRHDGFATFKEQIDMVKAMTAAHHGFAFAWNNGNHSSGSRPMGQVTKWYPTHLFARNRSYPAFGNSSINDDLGSGEVEKVVDGKTKRVLDDGDTEGGINLGFAWKNVVDEADKWSVVLSNALCKAPMTVDVTPRRCQAFKPKPGAAFTWTNTASGEGAVTADPHGLVTISKVAIKPGEETTLTIQRK